MDSDDETYIQMCIEKDRAAVRQPSPNREKAEEERLSVMARVHSFGSPNGSTNSLISRPYNDS